MQREDYSQMSLTMYARIATLFFVLTGLLMLLGYAVGLVFGDPLAFMFIGLVLAAAINFATYFWSDKIVVKMARARIIQESDNPRLFAIVSKVAQEAGIPMPKVGIVPQGPPNAFATGRGPNKAVVVVTGGILASLSPDELEAVIGHEIGHVVHRDILISSVAATIAGVVSYLGQIALFSMMFGGSGQGGRGNSGNIVALAMAAILVPLGATFVRLGISRSFEYNADEYGAKLTRKPGALISALTKISSQTKNSRGFGRRGGMGGGYGGMGQPQSQSPTSASTASLWIVNPFSGHSLVELFSTHPSTPNRIKKLHHIAEEMGMYVP
jgi:heat shock protein HtpX